jgi:hypothetical protein
MADAARGGHGRIAAAASNQRGSSAPTGFPLPLRKGRTAGHAGSIMRGPPHYLPREPGHRQQRNGRQRDGGCKPKPSKFLKTTQINRLSRAGWLASHGECLALSGPSRPTFPKRMLGKRLLTPCRPQFSVIELQKLSRKCPIWGEFKNFEGLGLQPLPPTVPPLAGFWTCGSRSRSRRWRSAR